MSTHTSDTGEISIEDVVEGIEDADIPASEKHALLDRIQGEGGVHSQLLREDLIRLFEGQETQEQIFKAEANAFLQKEPPPDAVASGDAQLAGKIVAEILAEQRATDAQFTQGVIGMRGDVQRMERTASQATEGQRRDVEQQTIQQLRQSLKGE